VEEDIILSQRIIEKCQTRSSLLLDDVLKLSKAISGENHTLTGKVYQNIGSNHLMRDEYKEALQSFEQSLQIQKSANGEHSS
jgi:tetratricopeptide (TPR) repeat protein